VRALRARGAVLLALALAFTGACDAGLEPFPLQPGIESEALDWTTSPCTDFYQFACGNWKRWHPLPADLPALSREVLVQREQILTEYELVGDDVLGRPHADDPDAAKIRDYYTTCRQALESDAIGGPQLVRRLGLVVDGLRSTADLAMVVGSLRAEGTTTLVGLGVGPAPDAPTTNIVFEGAAALGMEATYFTDADRATYRSAYVAHVDALVAAVRPTMTLPPNLTGALILRVETALAAGWPRPEDSRDAQTSHRASLAELAAAAPSFDWVAFFGAAGLPDSLASVEVDGPKSLAVLEQVVSTTPLPELRAYLAWRVLEADAGTLGASIRPLEFDFHLRLFGGAQQDQPPYWRCFLSTRSALGYSLSRPFVARTFDAERRTEATKILDAIRAQMRVTLDDASWLDDPTRAEGQAKLAAVVSKVGFPDSWTPYDGFETSGADYLTNVVSRRRWLWARELTDLVSPVDRTRWDGAPLVANAWYAPNLNDITFPAAILQKPFFDVGRPAAINYGSIGSIMGHELTHGFDDEGRHYDATGALRQWWTPAVADAFSTKAACIVAQFDGYHPVPGTRVNGALTLGETIADLGGLKLSHAAFHAAAGGAGRGSPGYFSPDQQFFVAYAQATCENERPAYLKTLLASDPHPPWRERVNGAVRNVPAFASAFACGSNAPLAPAARCQVW
jgi:putative endopeptidase